jgi:hypothetical protein
MSSTDGMQMGSIVFNMLSSISKHEPRQLSKSTIEEAAERYENFKLLDKEVAVEVLRAGHARPEGLKGSPFPRPEGISHWGIHLEAEPEAPVPVVEASVPLLVRELVESEAVTEAKARAAAFQEFLKTQDFGYMAQEDVMTVKPIVVASGTTVLCFWREKGGSGAGRKIGPKLYLSSKNDTIQSLHMLEMAYKLYRSHGEYA